MGRLLLVHPCPVCNYHIEGELHEGDSGVDTTFLRNHFGLGVCRHCHEIVSMLIPNSEQEIADALKRARSALVQMEADAAIGDPEARDRLPVFQRALDNFNADVPAALIQCSQCGSTEVEILTSLDKGVLDSDSAWIQCPRCEEGQLLVETIGTWDE